MAERTRDNPTGAPLTPPPVTARRLWGRVLAGKPIPIKDDEIGLDLGLEVVYDLDRVMGLDQHRPALWAAIRQAETARSAAFKARRVAFADQWADVVARHLGATQPVTDQLDQIATILAAPDSGADKLVNLRRYLGPLESTAPTPAEWAAYQAAEAEIIAAEAADQIAFDDWGGRQRWLAIIADVVIAVGVTRAVEGGSVFEWPADAGPRPDPRDPATWADVPDLVLSWLCGAGVRQAGLQVDSFRFGRLSVPTSRG